MENEFDMNIYHLAVYLPPQNGTNGTFLYGTYGI